MFETVPGTSFAEKLAHELIKKGISSIIVASKTSVNRFNGNYYPTVGEEKDVTMCYRVEKGPDNIRIVRGKVGVGVRMQKEYTEYFLISKNGIGFASSLNKDLRANFKGDASRLKP